MKSKLATYWICALFMLTVFCVQFTIAKPYVDGKIYRALDEKEQVDVIITFKQAANPQTLSNNLRANKNTQNTIRNRIPDRWFETSINENQLDLLSNNDDILNIYISQMGYVLLEESKDIIGAKTINSNYGYRGKFQTVCLIDSGVDLDHPAFDGKILLETCYCRSREGSNEYCCEDGTNQSSGTGTAQDNLGHGTSVAGILVGNDVFTNGVAPDASLIVAKVCNSSGSCSMEDVAEAVKWCVNNKAAYNVSAISISIGTNWVSDDSSYCDTLSTGIAIENAWNASISVIVGSGNGGYTSGISQPACGSKVISVGASYDEDFNRAPSSGLYEANCYDENVGIDNITCFTNRAQILDVISPGYYIKAAYIDATRPREVYGTSMATPFVSGTVLLLKEADNTLSPIEIYNFIISNGKKIKDNGKSQNNGAGTNYWFPVLNTLSSFQYDWSTFHHDYRRTGFSLLKGDMDSVNDVKEKYVLLETNGDTDAVARSSVSDIDKDDKQDTVTVVSHLPDEGSRNSTIYGAEYERAWYYLWLSKRMNVKWDFHVTNSVVLGAPTLDDVDGEADDWNDEVLIGLENGSIFVLDVDDGDDASEKWQYNASKVDSVQGKVNSVSTYDLDLDGTKEIVYVDYRNAYSNDWDARLFVLEDDGSTYSFIDDIIVSNGGAAGDLSIGDIDGDNYPEIVVPTFYGVKVYNLTNDVLYLEWSAPYGLIEGDVVIYDINKDNHYELIFTTNEVVCEQGSCSESIIVLNGSDSGSLITSQSTSAYGLSRTTPAIADIDSDGNPNIIVTSRESSDPSNQNGNILSYEYSTSSNTISEDWQFPSASGVLKTSRLSPSIADIDGDNDYEVIFAENNDKQLYVLQPNGQILFNYTFEGLVGSAPALADVNNDNKIDIVVKRAGSPYSILSMITINNTQPEFDYQIPNISTIEGDLIDINESGLLCAYDEDGDTITISYSDPFNATGLWQTDNNSSGNYSILIEVADQNLSNYMYVDIFVFENTTTLYSEFNDSTSNLSLNFSSAPQNYTKYIRLPKNMEVLYAEFRYEGDAS